MDKLLLALICIQAVFILTYIAIWVKYAIDMLMLNWICKQGMRANDYLNSNNSIN